MSELDDLLDAVRTLTPAEAQRLATNADTELFVSTVVDVVSSGDFADMALEIEWLAARSLDAWPDELADYLDGDVRALALTAIRCAALAIAFAPRLSETRRYELSYAWMVVELARKHRQDAPSPDPVEAAIATIQSAAVEDAAAFLADEGLLWSRPCIRTSEEVLRAAAHTIADAHPALYPPPVDRVVTDQIIEAVRRECLEAWYRHFVVTAPHSLRESRRERLREWVERNIGRRLGPGPTPFRS